MRKYQCFVATIAMFWASSASAETLKGGYPGCVSKETLDQFYDAALKHDDMAAGYLLDRGECVMTVPGVKVTVLSTVWGTVRIRAYSGKKAAELWTSAANVRP